MVKIDVAVIPCAGAGTRLRPATRVVPKPLIPVVDRPVIQYVIEEAVSAGVSEVVLVVDHRPGDPVLSHFVEGPPIDGLSGVRFRQVIQEEAKGLGDAVLCAAEAVGDRPFVCLLADRFPAPGSAFIDRMVAAFDGRAVVAIHQVPDEMLDRYGVVRLGGPAGDGLVEVLGAVEKPGRGQAPSSMALVGRYVLPAQIFDELRAVGPGHGGEIQLTDAIDRLAGKAGALGLVVADDLLDVGNPAGLLEATATVGITRPDLAPQFREAIERLLKGAGRG